MFRILFTLFILVGAIMPAQAGSTFTNPIPSDGADPWVVRHDDGFTTTPRQPATTSPLWRTRDIADLEHAERRWSGCRLRAPSMAPTSGRSSCTGSMAAGTSISPPRQGYDPAAHVRAAIRGGRPVRQLRLPQETDAGKISDASDKWGHRWHSAGIRGPALLHLVGLGGGRQRAAAHLHRQDGLPWRLAGARVEISLPRAGVERIGTPQVNEAPQVLLGPEGRLFPVHSASGSWTDDLLPLPADAGGEDPMNPAHWRKQPEPVFSKDEGKEVYGPGP